MPPTAGCHPSSPCGLSSVAAADRLAEHGPNVVPRGARPGVAQRVLMQLRDPMILLLLGACVVVTLTGDLADASLILVVICLNTAIGVVQDVRAANALEALERLASPTATVVRDGHRARISAADLVPGDHVILGAGDVVPADIGVTTAAGLQVDESAMTGESVPVARAVGSELLAGTVVTRGRAEGAVVRTGRDSALGRIAAAVIAAGDRATPLQIRLARLSRQLVVLALLLAAIVLAMGVARGEPPGDMVVLAVSLAVAAIPESLPAVVTVALALGAFRMARRHALVRRLPAVETLGSVTVLASDKTGTLTEGLMTVKRVWTPHGTWEVDGSGYDEAGAFRPAVTGPEPTTLVRDLALCNDARLTGPEGGSWQPHGDPMEAALLVAAAKHDRAALRAGETWQRVDEVPFDSATKLMTTLHRGPEGGLVVCKGAPEAVLPLVADRPIAAAAQRQAEDLAAGGFRVLAVADAESVERPPDLAAVAGLELRGLVALIDPPRAAAREVVLACRDAGIHLVMITGDHPATARAIADQLSITEGAPTLATGADVAAGGHVDRVTEIGVYARTRPEDKVDIVDAWQRRGAVVAMTGDGVNDAPALRAADIGVAMGNRGTEVARQASDLVLADDDLRTVVAAVQEGRRIYSNIRRFLRYGLAGGLAEVLVLMVAPWLGMPLPLTPGQILWINMVTHGVPGVAFGGEPADPADMGRPSPSPERSVLGGLVPQIVASAVAIAAVAVAAGTAAIDTAVQQTSVFLCLGLAQLWLALALRAPRRGTGWHSRGLEVAVAGAALLLVAGVVWTPLQELLGTVGLGTDQAALVALTAPLPAVATLAWTRLTAASGRRRRGAGGQAAA